MLSWGGNISSSLGQMLWSSEAGTETGPQESSEVKSMLFLNQPLQKCLTETPIPYRWHESLYSVLSSQWSCTMNTNLTVPYSDLILHCRLKNIMQRDTWPFTKTILGACWTLHFYSPCPSVWKVQRGIGVGGRVIVCLALKWSVKCVEQSRQTSIRATLSRVCLVQTVSLKRGLPNHSYVKGPTGAHDSISRTFPSPQT